MLFDDVANETGEVYIAPKFKMIHILMHEHEIAPIVATKAQIAANEKFQSKGLIPHKADNDVLRHIWAWEAIQKMIE